MQGNLQNRIKERRTELGLSQEELAKACDVSQSTVANWEGGGHIPRQATLARIAEALDIEQIWLLGGEQTSNQALINTYLDSPIRHVPVYDWPKNNEAFEKIRPKLYVAMTITSKNVFALLAPETGTEFPKDTVLTFTRNYTDNMTGPFLKLTETEVSLTPYADEHTVAKLAYSIIVH